MSGYGSHAIHFGDSAGKKSLTLSDSRIGRDRSGGSGTAVFFGGDGNDGLTILGHSVAGMTARTTIWGDVAFGAGDDDRLTFSTCREADIGEGNACEGQMVSAGDLALDHAGAFTGLESIRKVGSGAVRLTGLRAAGARMSLEEGDLRLAGHLDLGRGHLTIHDATRLIFGKTASGHGRITAGEVKFAADDWWKLFMEAGALEAGSDVLVNDDGRFRNNDGAEVAPTLSGETGDEIVGLTVAGNGEIGRVPTPQPQPDPVPLAGYASCGEPPANGGAIVCDETTWTRGSGADDDPVIEYSFSGDGAYTIEFSDNPGDDRDFAVETTADYAYGLHGSHDGSGALAVAMSGGTIDTEGSFASGLSGWAFGSGDVEIDLSTGNAGSGDCGGEPGAVCDIHTRGMAAHGIFGLARPEGESSSTVTIGMSGGSIRTEGLFAHGLYGKHEGSSGAIAITMSGGSIETEGRFADGIHAASSGAVEVSVSGSRVEVSGYGSHAIHFGDSAGEKSLTLSDSRIGRARLGDSGTAVFFGGDGNDGLTILGHSVAGMTARTTIRGDVAFGAGDGDRLTFSTCREADIGAGNACEGQMVSAGDLALDHAGAFTGLESIRKVGSGAARLTGLRAAGARMSLEEGDLRLTGHLDLGDTGSLAIHDGSRLIFGAGSDDAGGLADHGRITAAHVQFDGGEANLYLSDGSHEALDERDVLTNAGGEFLDSADRAVSPGLYNEAGERIGGVTEEGVVSLGETAGARGSGGGGGFAVPGLALDGDGGTVAASGLATGGNGGGFAASDLALGGLFLAFDLSDEEEEAEAATGVDGWSVGLARSGGDGAGSWTRYWPGRQTRLAGGEALRLEGVATGTRREFGNGFRASFSALPALRMEGAGDASSLSGGLMMAGGAWGGEPLHAGLRLAHGRYEASDLMTHPLTGEVQESERTLTQSHAEVGGGSKVRLFGWQVRGQASLFTGALHQRGHVAAGRVLLTDVPSFDRPYDGWRAGLGLRPASWLPAGRLSWRPSLKLSTMRVHDRSAGTAMLHHRDRAGVMSFDTPAETTGLSRQVHSLDLGVGIRLPDGGVAGLALRHLQVDGESQNSVTAGLRYRF